MADTATLGRSRTAIPRPVTLKDVARKAGVSTAAVSRSFTPGAPVSEEMRAHVLATAEAMGYRPNRLAAGLASGRTGLVGLVTDDFVNPAVSELLGHFTNHLQDRGYRPIVMNLGGDATASTAMRMVQEYGVEALVLLSPTLPLPFIRAFHDSGLSVVQTFDLRSHQPFISQCAVQDAAAGRLAATTLHERGYVRPAFIGGPGHAQSVRNPLPGFKLTCEKLGLEPVFAEAEGWSYEGGYRAVAALRAEGCDACFCANDLLAIGALAALRDDGVSVPQEFGVIGLDDIAMAGWQGIGLTTIGIPRAEIAAECIDLMQAHMSRPDAAPESRMIKPVVVERATLRPAAGT